MNAELIERLRRPFVMSMFANRGDLYESSECERHEAADALEAADKRIAELEAINGLQAQSIGILAKELDEAERKLAVARGALEKANHFHDYDDVLAQIGGDDAG